MKKFLFMLIVVAVMGLAVPVNAACYLAGDFNGWDPAGQLMDDNGDGTYSALVTGIAAGARQEFKVTNGTWDVYYPPANSWLFADDLGNVTVTFNENLVSDGWTPEQYRIGVSTDSGNWSVVGDLNGWNNADPTMAMISQGGGIYKLTQTFAAGTYRWKAVVTGSWDAIGLHGRDENATTLDLIVAEGDIVDFYVDALGGTVKAEIIPEPATMALLAIGGLGLLRRKRS